MAKKSSKLKSTNQPLIDTATKLLHTYIKTNSDEIKGANQLILDLTKELKEKCKETHDILIHDTTQSNTVDDILRVLSESKNAIEYAKNDILSKKELHRIENEQHPTTITGGQSSSLIKSLKQNAYRDIDLGKVNINIVLNNTKRKLNTVNEMIDSHTIKVKTHNNTPVLFQPNIYDLKTVNELYDEAERLEYIIKNITFDTYMYKISTKVLILLACIFSLNQILQ